MWADFFDYCSQRHGPVHLGAAAAISGMSVTAIRRRARREGWWIPYGDVVAPPGTPQTPEYRALAAVARAAGPSPDRAHGAALTRWSAVAAYGILRGWPTAVEVAVDGQRSPARDARFRPVRSRSFDTRRVRRIGDLALPVVDAAWLVRDLAPVVTAQLLTNLVIDLVQQRHLALEALVRDLDAHPRYPGRRNVVAAVERLQQAGRTDSPPELEVRERLLAEGIPLDVGQVAVVCRDGRTIHLDLGIAAIRFAIEMDSMVGHARRDQLLRDARRANELARLADDWRVLHMTVEDLGSGWSSFVALVREVVREQSVRLLGCNWPGPAGAAGPPFA